MDSIYNMSNSVVSNKQEEQYMYEKVSAVWKIKSKQAGKRKKGIKSKKKLGKQLGLKQIRGWPSQNVKAMSKLQFASLHIMNLSI